ncbi:hypothetical protein BCR34DRAFT_585818 [Clohesyomyces aquaticus]|uniref:BRCT domain-containing protein n=1 Tax=Clohesyomyces aquaticus TaxID=1231657 RepID=A0A1Y1ZW27_9PLEO|nr:hypothetical protein BCR34DRAFT_585818 [Clohesyomyces aquaticus]
MAWKLLEKTSTSQDVDEHVLTAAHQSHYLVLGPTGRLSILSATGVEGISDTLGRITIWPWGVKLEALNGDVAIQPAHPRANPSLIRPSEEEYKLKQCINNGNSRITEIIFLREGDRIYLSQTTSSLTLSYDPSEVQVNSSVTGDDEIAESEELGETAEPSKLDGPEVGSAAEEETADEEDEVDHDQTLVAVETTQVISQLSRSTPHPSAARSEIIQETPTMNRMVQATESFLKAPIDTVDPTTVENISSASPSAVDVDMDSTAPTKPTEAVKDLASDELKDGTDNVAPIQDARPKTLEGSESKVVIKDAPSPGDASMPKDKATYERESSAASEPEPQGRRTLQSVKITSSKRVAKRASPDEESTASTPVRPNKRAKKELGGTQDSLESYNIVSAKKPVAKRKGRASTDEDESTINLTGSQKSGTADDAYKGPKPRIALSNSTIDDSNHVFKNFKRLGGTKVNNVKAGDCNLLCVRKGTLNRTSKVLQSIALGIPIVTDDWLFDSVKKGRLFELEPYMPSVPAFEKDLNFKLATVWSKPQPDLLTGKVVYFTPALKKVYSSFKDMEEVCKAVGARRAISKPGKELKNSDDTVVMAKDEQDEDLAVLTQNGHTCYSKDLITIGIMRGDIDLESAEFKITPEVGKTKKKGRPRKS